MTETWTCAQGHTWEKPAGDGAAPEMAACPTCGVTKVRRINLDPVPIATSLAPACAAEGSARAARPGNGTMPFTLVRQHAQGGLGQISLARDDAIQREVAFKQILSVHADNPALRKRFLYEARITGQLEHPSIVPVYCLGDDAEGRPYYVMRFVRGRTLDDIITENIASPNAIVFRELLRRFIAVCQAVAYAHSRGVIHRDLKPSNVMLGDYGETLVLDWGLAKDIKNKTDPPSFTAAATLAPGNGGARKPIENPMATLGKPGSELTLDGQVIGTPAYMAPEQASGRTDLHGPVTDIYALGGILYKILTGSSPTPAKGATRGGAADRLTFVESPPPSKLNPAVDPGLEAICRRAMATDPAGRYPRALEMAQEIQRWLDEHPLSVRTPSWFSRIAIPIGLLLLAAILAVGFLLLQHHPL
ncbi:MAG TPA: serine/threonine-protein kinase [Phycisphaerae bacterium]|nr:serine/threonine-protein kinase [Phycisphaerae bacterium]